MSDPIRHHYVPRRYLEEFEFAGNGLTGIEKPSGKSFPTSPATAAVEKNLNTVDFFDGQKDQKTIEGFFSNIEQSYPHFLDKARNRRICGEVIDYFVTMAIHQLMRTPRVRRQLTEILLKLNATGLLEKHKATFSNFEIQTLDRAKNGQKRAINQLGLMVSGHFAIALGFLLEGMGFAFLYSENATSLITTDNPAQIAGIIGSGSQVRAALPTLGRRRVLLFPIAPDVLVFGSTSLKSDSGLIILKDQGKINKGTINSVNSILAITADRFIYLPKNNPRPPQICIRNKLSDCRQAARVFNGPYSKLLGEAVKRLDKVVA
ncbi:MAG: DUF4238 domain-containing protein [Pseudomonadota bacterium]